MGAQVGVERRRDPATQHDQALDVAAGQQGVLVTREVEVLQAQAGERAARGERRVQVRQALDLAHGQNLPAVSALVAPATVSALGERVSAR